MRRRYELTDREWSIIAPLLPNKPRGVPRVDDRRVLNGILWRFRAGTPWAEIPERYGPPTTLRVPADRDHGFQAIVITHSRAS
jgi:transposase